MYIGDNPSQWLLATAGRLERLRVFDEESEMDHHSDPASQPKARTLRRTRGAANCATGVGQGVTLVPPELLDLFKT